MEDIEMKTITYNPETHVLVPREPGLDITEPGWEAVAWEDIRSPSQLYLVWKAMLAAAPQPEPVDVGSVGWKHDCAALCANDIELWIDRCPHCGKPRHNHPPTDDELLNKAEQVESEPAMWVMKHIRSGDLAQAKPNQKALHPYMLSDAFPLHTTPQPDRTAELEDQVATLQEQLDLQIPAGVLATQRERIIELEADVAIDGLDGFLVANDPTEFGCACDLSVGYLCGPCHAAKQQESIDNLKAQLESAQKSSSHVWKQHEELFDALARFLDADIPLDRSDVDRAKKYLKQRHELSLAVLDCGYCLR